MSSLPLAIVGSDVQKAHPRTSWHLVTGEYGPRRGGVAGYSRAVARALAARGEDVHVWAPPHGEPLVEDRGVRVHPLARGFDVEGLRSISRALATIGRPTRILLQYVPHAFGLKGMNMALPLWLASLRDAQVWVMFHEVFVPWGRWRQSVQSAITRTMAAIVVSRADRVFVSVPRWETLLRGLAPWRREFTWLPVPANVPTEASEAAVLALRRDLWPEAPGHIVGHFGSYNPLVVPLLKRAVLETLQADRTRVALLIGRGSEAVSSELAREPSLQGRVRGTGPVPEGELACYLRACDVMLQPFPDGVSGRRTSVMAGLALGLPVVTNEGPMTEPVWHDSGAVALATSPEGLPAAVASVLSDPARRARLGACGKSTYERHFSLARTIEGLCEDTP